MKGREAARRTVHIFIEGCDAPKQCFSASSSAFQPFEAAIGSTHMKMRGCIELGLARFRLLQLVGLE